ncbi:uncharacterized protein LOC111024680 [Momordica charantia]|uniref:Uncharacterized protein LOC111024680 n=1 Tax=Momordica charantia TaxID=3673 RepID=A0A6J1DWD2_MOMCH|nr:uncharacterized protein LOC111024680 [Momordica charantia]
MFEYGLRLPLHPFVQEFLFRTGLAPAQVAPNGWGVIFALAILFWLRARDSEEAELLDVDQLLACFEAKRIAKKPGRFYMCARKGAGGIVKGPTSIKGWVRKWFYASGEWLAKDESGRSFFDVPTRFGNLVSIRPVPELTQASFDTLKYYKERFPRGRKVGTLVTDELLLESGLLDYNPAVRPIESSRPNSELGEKKI